MRKLGLILLISITAGITLVSLWYHTLPHPEHYNFPIHVVCTTEMIGQAVQAIGCIEVDVTVLMGPGVDPHLYRPRERDITALSEADLIVYNGLHLEGKMTDLFASLKTTKPTLAIGDMVPRERLRIVDAQGGVYDPHIWFDVRLWADAVAHIADALSEINPAGSEFYHARAQAYQEKLYALDDEVRELIARIPREQRVLITAHDAFGYFGRAYDMEVVGLQGVSTDSEIRISDVERLIDLIVTRKIRTMFVEASLPERALYAVKEGVEQRGGAIRVGDQLFSDTLGEPGTPEASYEGAVRHNVNAMIKGLLS